jgi:Domain of unknown function (DUF4398)
MVKRFSLIVLLILLGSCGLVTTRPKLEMSFAAVAFMAAQDADAPTLSPNLYRKAEHYYLKAKSNYKKKYFNKAKQYAILSQQFSEQAELSAQLKKIEQDN